MVDAAALVGSRQRVERALAQCGIAADILEFPQGTRTSAEAAMAIGCEVAQIAKSVVLRAKKTEMAIVVIASGANRVCEKKLAALIGEPVGRADADFVRAKTGFAIGGVAPVGHLAAVHLLVDRDLLAIDPLWAAAGTPSSVFRVSAQQLSALPGARLADIKLIS